MLDTTTIRRSLRRPLIVALPLVGTAGFLTACGGDSASSTSQSESTSETSGAPTDGGGHGDNSPVADDARQVEVTARSFGFDSDEITVTAGEDIAIALTSEDGLHDFTIDELDAHVTVDAGDSATGGFRADEPGRYTFYCSVPGHREAGMEGELVIEG